MPFYAFKLTSIKVIRQRGRIPDDDIVTLTVLVNQSERGSGGGLLPALATSDYEIPVSAVQANTLRGAMSRDWIIGPFELTPGDQINIIYSGTNVSDSELTLDNQAAIELKILSTILSASVGAIGGAVGSVISGALGLIGDPVKTILGFHTQGPCNGLVFSDNVAFTAQSLNQLNYSEPQIVNGYLATRNHSVSRGRVAMPGR